MSENISLNKGDIQKQKRFGTFGNVLSFSKVANQPDVSELEAEQNDTYQNILKSDEPRQAWSNQIEFILTCVGYAVGLGNVWRFPYLCFKNGGGAFLIPYVICLFLVGIPIFYLELSLGQFASLGPLKVWTINPALKGLGMCLVIIPGMIAIYYNVVIAYCIYFFFASMTSSLPWVTCDNSWNTCDCRDSTLNMSLADPWQGSRPECLNYTINKTTSASEEYFFEKVLGRSGGVGEPGNVKWDVMLCNLLGWFVVFLVLSKGIQSLGKVVYFSAIFPYVLLTVLLVRGLTLDGYYDGIMFYITPDWDKVANANVWSDAATQIFFSLSACQGGLIAMASYNKFTNLTLRDALLVPIINCLTSFYAGFAIFSVLGFMAYSKGVSVEDVATGGPGLVFIVYPEGLSQMPVPTLWAVLFFFMMMTLGFSSQFSIVEAVITGLMDQFSGILNTKWRKIGFRLLICLTGFLLGLPMVTEGGYYIFELTDHFISGFPMLFIGLAELIAINYIYGFWNFKQDIEMMLGQNICITISFYFFGTMWCFVSPLCLAAVIVAKCIDYEKFVSDGYVYPDWAQAIGWLIVAGALFFMPLWYIIYMCKNGLFTLCRRLNSPTSAWGPARPENRTGPRYSKTVEVSPITNLDVEGGLYKPKVISYEPGEPRGYANGSFSHPNTAPSAPVMPNGGIEESYEPDNHGYVNASYSHQDEPDKTDDSTKF